MGGDHAIFAACLGLRGLQAVGVALVVLELQRIAHDRRHRYLGPQPAIKHIFEALLGADAHVCA